MRLPDATHRACADASRLRHHVCGPLRRLAQRLLQRQRHHALGDFRPEWWNARGPRLVAEQSFEAFGGEALLPASHAGLGVDGLQHDLDGPDAIAAQQSDVENDLGTPSVLLRCIAIPDQRIQALAINRRNGEGYSCGRAPDSHPNPRKLPGNFRDSGSPHRRLLHLLQGASMLPSDIRLHREQAPDALFFPGQCKSAGTAFAGAWA